MINNGPHLIAGMLVGTLGGAVALSVGMTQSAGLPYGARELGNLYRAIDVLSILVAVPLVGDRRIKAILKRLASDGSIGVLRVLLRIARRNPRRSGTRGGCCKRFPTSDRGKAT